jgi:hypothetical protein
MMLVRDGASLVAALADVFFLALVVQHHTRILELTRNTDHLQVYQMVVAAVELVALVVGLGAEQVVRVLHLFLQARRGVQEVLRALTLLQVLAHHQVLLLEAAAVVGAPLVVLGQ